jgi:hypothetical protein
MVIFRVVKILCSRRKTERRKMMKVSMLALFTNQASVIAAFGDDLVQSFNYICHLSGGMTIVGSKPFLCLMHYTRTDPWVFALGGAIDMKGEFKKITLLLADDHSVAREGVPLCVYNGETIAPNNLVSRAQENRDDRGISRQAR